MPDTQSQQHYASSADPADTTIEASSAAEPIDTRRGNPWMHSRISVVI